MYDPPGPKDGLRVLVMRYWPRGIKKERVELWLKELSPSPGLIKRWQGKKISWEEFRAGYLKEMAAPEVSSFLDELCTVAREKSITLLCGCPDERRCHRSVLKELVVARLEGNIKALERSGYPPK